MSLSRENHQNIHTLVDAMLARLGDIDQLPTLEEHFTNTNVLSENSLKAKISRVGMSAESQ